VSVSKKKSYEILKQTRAPIKGIGVNGKMLKFNENGQFVTHDAGLAREIEGMYGHKKGNGAVRVIEVDDLNPSYNRGSDGRRVRASFVVPRLPWHEEDA
jgi:hypothetical protein